MKRMIKNKTLFRGIILAALAFSPFVDLSALAGQSIIAANPDTARCNGTATLLQDGTVLVAGGTISEWTSGDTHVPLATAVRYDPADNSWSNAADLGTAYYSNAAVMLPSGKVFVVSKNPPPNTSVPPQVYDPASNTWTYDANWGDFKHATATLLQNGKVLVTGYGVAAMVYDPTNNTWSFAGYPATSRYNHTGTLLPSGKVLFTGGLDSHGPLATGEIYDPAANTWTPSASMANPRYQHTATLLHNGKVLVQGGRADYYQGIVYAAELYDPETDTWSSAGTNPYSTWSSSATLLIDGRVAVIGGSDARCLDKYSPTSDRTVLYDPATGTWQADGTMAAGRSFHSAMLLPDGNIFLTGACDCEGNPHGSSAGELYNPTTKSKWTATATLTTPRQDHTATMLPDGQTLVVGGTNNGTYLRSTELFAPTTNSWSSSGSLSSPRSKHTATLLTNGKVLIAGGTDGSNTLDTTELYDPATGTWVTTGGMLQARQGHSATLLANGDVLVIGGFNGATPLKSAAVYSPGTGTWRPFAELSAARANHTATLLEDGTILVAGGFDGVGYLDAVELYDPVAKKWSMIPSLGSARAYHTATLASDGSVTIAGGKNATGAISTLEYFHPENGVWSEIDSLATSRSGHTATLLSDGNILLAGGASGSAYPAITDVYSPVTDLSYSGGSLATARAGHTATLQPDGSVLIVGGYNSTSGSLSSVELFTPNAAVTSNLQPLVSAAGVQSGRSGLLITGNNFRGISEGSSGTSNSTATNYPVVQFKRLDNGQTSFLRSDPDQLWSNDRFVSEPLADLFLPYGYYQATLFANAIQGQSKLVRVDSSVTTAPKLSMEPVPVDFGTAAEATTKTVTLTNDGNAELVVSEISVTGQDASLFQAAPETRCYSAIPPEQACVIDITYTPATSNPAKALLRILSNDPQHESYDVPLVSWGPQQQFNLGLAFSGPGTGKVTITAPSIEKTCSSNCSHAFNSGTSVTLTPSPTSGSVFVGWSGCGSTNGTLCLVNMSDNKSVTATFSDIAIATSSLPDAYVTVSYSQTLVATGGTPTYTWARTSGSLPTGLGLTPGTNIIAGTPTTAGTATFTITATDQVAATATKTFTIATYALPAITTATLAGGKTATPYSQTLTASGGKGPLTWSIVSGSLPAGLSLDSTTGIISGTPTTTGNGPSFTVKVEDANGKSATKSFTIAITTGAVAVATTALPKGAVGVSYSFALTAIGGTAPYTWSKTAGTIPAGLILSSDGILSGTPTATATNSSITFQVKDANNATATKALSLTIATTDLAVSTNTLPDGFVGLLYDQSLTATGGTPPYTWSVSSGTLPSGLLLNAAGRISPYPDLTGTSSFTVRVRDANSASATKVLSIRINEMPTISPTPMPNGIVGTPFIAAMSIQGSYSPYTWAISPGTLPPGLSFDPVTKTISGIPTVAGSYNFSILVKGTNGITCPQPSGINVSPMFQINTEQLSHAYVGSPYRHDLSAEGGIGPYTWSLTEGTLPAGLQFYGNLGKIEGMPTSPGTKTIVVRVVDSMGRTASKALTIEAYEAPIIETTETAAGSVGKRYSQTFTASGGKPPYTWSIASGVLPDGLTLDAATGIISGTPTVEYSDDFTVKVRDDNNRSHARGFYISIWEAIPRVELSSLYLLFGYVMAGSTSTKTVTLTNVSQDTLAIGLIEPLTAPFAIMADTCSNSNLAPAGSCTVTVQFTPLHSGYSHTALLIPTSDAYYPLTTMDIDGSGVFPYVIPDTGAGESVRNPQFLTVESQSVHDGNTLLSWQKQGSTTKMTWSEADNNCKNLVFDGQGGWRLPSFLELSTIVHYGTSNPSIDTTKFSDIVPDSYWTSTTGTGLVNGNVASIATTINFQFGETDTLLPSAEAYVLCARGEKLISSLVPKGSPPHDTSTDLSTGLVWVTAGGLIPATEMCQANTCRPADWEDISFMCNHIIYADERDWRAPTLKELATLPDLTSSWSITPSLKPDGQGGLSQAFAFDRGTISSVPKVPLADYHIRCVRGGSRQLAHASVTPLTIDFGTTDLGSNPTRSVTVTNSGGGSLSIGTIAPPAAPFAIIGDTCSGNSLAGGASCTVTVQLAPAAIGNYTGSITIPTSDTTVTVPLTGTATTPAPVIGNLTIGSIGPDSAVITWSTDQQTTGAVQFGTTTGYGYSTASATLTTQHSMTLNGLTPGTVYHLKAISTNATGVEAASGDYSFVTQTLAQPGQLPADNYLTLQEAYNRAAHNDSILALSRTYAEDLSINRPITATLKGGYDTAAYTSRTGATVLNGSLTITDGTLIADNLTITGSDPNSNLSIYNVTATGTTITWNTNLLANSRIDFGETVAYGGTIADKALTTAHSIVLTGLKPGTTYHFKVTSVTPTGITAASDDYVIATPAFVAATIAESGNVTVMEVSGDFNAKNGDGSSNDMPRAEVAKEYLRHHSDSYDFLVFLTTFDYAMLDPMASGFYTGIKNDIQGINDLIFDSSSQFGSNGKLQGTIDLGNITALSSAPHGPLLNRTVSTLNHEIGHRFGMHVRFKKADGSLDTALIGRDGSHWSYLLDSKGSLMYGNGWQENSDGNYTSTVVRDIYSPLDLYLMGMIPKEQVPPMVLIDNQSTDKNQLPMPGASITGTTRTITIDDIIAAEGPRIPDATSSQKQFNVGFILLTRPGTTIGSTPAAIETLRTAWAGEFAELTRGIGKATGISPSLTVQVDSPADGATITGPDVTVTGTIINTTGAETGVMVNGIPATINGSSFVANHVPLQDGANIIEAKATDANGLTNKVTRNVTAQAGHYLRITSNIDSGTGPLEISLRMDGNFTVTNPTVTVAGPATTTLTAGASPTEFTANLTAEGTYTFTASAIGPDGQTYSDSLTVTVISKWQLDNLLRTKWTGMRTALAAGDISGAVADFNELSRDLYYEDFSGIAGSLPQIAAAMANITMVRVQDNVAEYDLRDVINNETFSYYLLFVKDGNGIWKIRNF